MENVVQDLQDRISRVAIDGLIAHYEEPDCSPIYGLSVYTSGQNCYSYALLRANTESMLDMTARKYSERGSRRYQDNSRGAWSRRLRWAPGNWLLDFEPSWSERDFPIWSSPDRDLVLYRTFKAALSTVDCWLSTQPIPRPMLLIACGDMSGEYLVHGMKLLNPPSAVERYIEGHTPAPFLRRLLGMEPAEQLETLIDLWKAFHLDSPSELLFEARAVDVTRFDIQPLIVKHGAGAVSSLVELCRQFGHPHPTAPCDRPAEGETSVRNPRVQLAVNSARLAVRAGVLIEGDVQTLLGVLRDQVESDLQLERASTLAPCIARALVAAQPRRFPRPVQDSKTNHLHNHEAYTRHIVSS